MRNNRASTWLVLLLATLTGLVSSLSSPTPVRAAELLMYEEQGCVWCARWNAEVAPAYPKTPEGRRAPLHRVDIHDRNVERDVGFALAAPVRATPTFVLVDHGVEVGRITGYPGADFFWGLLDKLFDKLDQAAPSAPPIDDAPGHKALGQRAASLDIGELSLR